MCQFDVANFDLMLQCYNVAAGFFLLLQLLPHRPDASAWTSSSVSDIQMQPILQAPIGFRDGPTQIMAGRFGEHTEMQFSIQCWLAPSELQGC